MSRKLLPLIAVLAVLSLIAAQCVVPTPTPAPVEEEVEEPVAEEVEEPMAEEEEAAEPAEEVTLVFSDWHLTEPHWEASLKEAFETYGEVAPNVNLELGYVSYGDKDTKYATEIDAGAGPDVIHLHAYSLRSFIERDFLRDLTSSIEGEEQLKGRYFEDINTVIKRSNLIALHQNLNVFGPSFYKRSFLNP